MVRPKPGDTSIIQLLIVALSDAPAINVEVMIQPLQGILRHLERELPLRIPVIDKSHPFVMDVAYRRYNIPSDDDELGGNVQLRVKYHDQQGNEFSHSNEYPLNNGMMSLVLLSDVPQKIVDSLEKIASNLTLRQ